MIAPARVTKEAADVFVERLHRHHKNATAGCRWVVGAWDCDRDVLCGVGIVGTPTGRGVPSHRIVEATRVCTDKTKNACSFLYALAAEVARALGWAGIITYTLREESGASLRALGWWPYELSPRDDDFSNRPGRATGGVRGEIRWLKLLNEYRAPAPIEVVEAQLPLIREASA